MKKTSTLCLLAALPMLSAAQESSKSEPAMAGMELGELVTRYARRTGKQFVIDPRVRAQVPLAGIDVGQLSHDQFLAVLDVHQVAVVDAGGILAIVPDANARQFPTPVYTDLDFKAADFDTVTVVLSPKRVCAPGLVPLLRPLQQQAAHLAADPQTNSLIISDHALNVRRIATLVEQLDRRGTGARDCWPSPAPTPPPATAAKPGS